MAACTQPGCTGSILDGYCDVCGSPPDAAPVAAAGDDEAPSTSTRTSSRLASTAIGSARGRTGVTRRVGTASRRLRAARLGAGLTTVPPRAPVDPSTAILVDPEVAESKRFCPSCGAEVGRSIDGRPGRTQGFCPQCRARYSFDPTLAPGDVVGGQYEVAGALAHGGLGWIYLARDRNVSDRWVVLKGLLNAGDADAQAAAIAERGFLAQVEHPRIVEIYNFVVHEGAGYTVMEYVGGTSLKQVLKERMAAAGRYDPLPLDQAIAYVLEILPAFEYLHDLGLVYCDFKPDNLIQVGDDVKLIDLGGVRRIDDVDSAIYGTVGYQAPEVPEVGTSVASDVYTIGRTLLVLAMEFRGYQSTYVDLAAPGRRDAAVPALRLVLPAGGQGLRLRRRRPVRLGRRAARAAARRAARGGGGRPGRGRRVGGCAVVAVRVARRGHLRADLARPAPAGRRPVRPAGRLARHPRRGGPAGPARRAGGVSACARPRCCSPRAAPRWRPVRPQDVAAVTDELLAADPWEWRAVWLQALAALARGDGAAAQAAFNAVYGQVPGELAPKLGLAAACEMTGETDIAEALYARVRPDRRRLRAARRVRAGPDPVGPRLRRPRPSRRWSWCRRPAGPTPRRGRTGPPRCWRPAGACRPSPRRWPASRSPASTRSSG